MPPGGTPNQSYPAVRENPNTHTTTTELVPSTRYTFSIKANYAPGEPPGHQRLLQHRHLQHPHRVYKGIPSILEYRTRPKRPQRRSPKPKSRWNLHFGGTEEWDIGIQVVFMSCYCGKVLPSR